MHNKNPFQNAKCKMCFSKQELSLILSLEEIFFFSPLFLTELYREWFILEDKYAMLYGRKRTLYPFSLEFLKITPYAPEEHNLGNRYLEMREARRITDEEGLNSNLT